MNNRSYDTIWAIYHNYIDMLMGFLKKLINNNYITF